MLETKILISYLAICITYTVCRLHYLMTVREDEEFNEQLGMLVDLGGKDIIKVMVVLQLFFCPLLAPISMVKRFIGLFIKKQD